jgi:DNA-binding response OmpR family regulator
VDGVEAVEKFMTFRPGVVLLDINMPRKDGFETATEMRNMERSHRWKRSTIVAVTAMSSELLKRRGIFECGIDAWRTKPVSIKDLKRDVETLLGGGTIS